MPHIQVTAQRGTFDQATQNKFMQEITQAVLIAEGANPQDPGALSLAWAYFNEHDQGDVYIGGENIATPPVLVQVTTPAGALNQAGRNSLAQSVATIVNDFVGSFDDRLNHWLLSNEIDPGSWASGNVFSIEDVRSAMNIPQPK